MPGQYVALYHIYLFPSGVLIPLEWMVWRLYSFQQCYLVFLICLESLQSFIHMLPWHSYLAIVSSSTWAAVSTFLGARSVIIFVTVLLRAGFVIFVFVFLVIFLLFVA